MSSVVRGAPGTEEKSEEWRRCLLLGLRALLRRERFPGQSQPLHTPLPFPSSAHTHAHTRRHARAHHHQVWPEEFSTRDRISLRVCLSLVFVSSLLLIPLLFPSLPPSFLPTTSFFHSTDTSRYNNTRHKKKRLKVRICCLFTETQLIPKEYFYIVWVQHLNHPVGKQT